MVFSIGFLKVSDWWFLFFFFEVEEKDLRVWMWLDLGFRDGEGEKSDFF